MNLDEMFNGMEVQKKIHKIGVSEEKNRATGQAANRRNTPDPDPEKVICELEKLIDDLKKNPDTYYLIVRKIDKADLPPNSPQPTSGGHVFSMYTNGSERFILSTILGLAKARLGVNLDQSLFE